MTRPEDDLEAVAKAVADGRAVDWKGAEQRDASSSGELAALREIERMHSLQRESAKREQRPRSLADRLHHGFEVGKLLGRGAFGSVWKARDVALDRPVALKILDRVGGATPADRARFIREARLLAQIEHPNVVRIWAIDELDGVPRLSLEFLDGSTLKELVEKQGPLSADEAAAVGIDICKGLAAAHTRGLVHRDVKPANVMRALGGRIVLLDFGLAASGSGPDLQSPGSTPGTPYMMAPELRSSSELAGPGTDLYALGVTLYWLVTGHYPWTTRDLDELFAEKRAGKFTPLRDRRADLPEGLAAVIHRLFDHDPQRRFASAGEVELALTAVLSKRAPSLVAPRRTATAWKAVVGVALLIAVAFGLDRAFRDPKPAPTTAPVEVRCQFVRHRPTEKGPDGVQIAAGSEVRPGDQITLELTAKEPLWVYVFNEDAQGVITNEFPLEGYQLPHRIDFDERGTTVRLPGRNGDGEQAWVISNGGGGEEAFIVLASRERNEMGEQFLDTYDFATAEAGARAVKATLESSWGKVGGSTLRGAGHTARLQLPPLAPSEPIASATTAPASGTFLRLDRLVRVLAEDAERDGDVAYVVVTFKNVGAPAELDAPKDGG